MNVTVLVSRTLSTGAQIFKKLLHGKTDNYVFLPLSLVSHISKIKVYQRVFLLLLYKYYAPASLFLFIYIDLAGYLRSVFYFLPGKIYTLQIKQYSVNFN